MYVGHCLCAIQEDDQQTDHLTCEFQEIGCWMRYLQSNWQFQQKIPYFFLLKPSERLLAKRLAMAKLASPLHFLSSAIATWNKGTIRKFNRGLLSWLHRSIDGKNMHQKAHLSGEAHFYQIGNIRLFKWIPWSGLWLGWGWSRGAWGACLRFGGVHALFGGWPGVRKRNIWPKCIMLHISY